MVVKAVWCSFLLLFLVEIRCSTTDRDLYVLKTDGNAEFNDEVQDAEPAETNTYSHPYSESTDDATSEDSSEDPPGPPEHAIPYSEHEEPGEVPTRPKYVAPGRWAKPDPKKNIPLDFVPTKSLAQVRGTHTVRVLPQSEAIAAATSAEERENAPRLRQVVSKKKTNTVYTEEGYEDSAYDHAGHIRDADFHEGYARKLHDQRQSEGRSGDAAKRKKLRRGKSRSKNSPPKSEEFEEFTDDYSDERSSDDKYESKESKETGRKEVDKIDEESLNRPEINPKTVAENEIEKLEDDLRREAEEAEKDSENYASVTETELLRVDGSQESSENRDKPEARFPSSKRQEKFYKEDYEATTIHFEAPKPRESEQYETSTLSYEDPTTVKFYLPEGSNLKGDYETTTIDYGNSNNQQFILNAEIPTTANYGDIFWKYFKTKSDGGTTPFLQEQNPPVALGTINGHGPYLLLSENGQVTQNPSQFGIGGTTYYPTTQSVVQNGHQYIDPFGVPDRDYLMANGQVANARSGYEFPGFVSSGGSGTSPFDNWGLKNGGYSFSEVPIVSTEPSTTRFYDSIAFSSTPGYSVITSPPNVYGSSADRERPLVNSVKEAVRKLDSYERENFGGVEKDWPENEKSSPTSKNSKINLANSESVGEEPVPFFNYTPNLKYAKILNYIKNQQNDKYGGQKSESPRPEDFTIMKPPTQRESVFYDFTRSSYPNVADYSSVKQESGAAHEINGKQFYPKKNAPRYNDLSRKGIRLKSPKFHATDPPALIDRKKLFPPFKLLPPTPNSRDNYADYIPIKQSSAEYNPSFGSVVKNYNPDPEALARYLNNRRIPSRYRRSLNKAVFNEGKIADAVIAREIKSRFDVTFEDQGSAQKRAVRESQRIKSRAKRNLIPDYSQSSRENSRPAKEEVYLNKNEKSTGAGIGTNPSSRGKRSHQDLLDASYKIAGDVVDGEINARFENEEKDGDEEEEEDEENGDEDGKTQRDKQVEVEVPDFDYLDEIQEVNNVDALPTTPAPGIDLRKYPFYNNNKVSNASPLKYVINPGEVPRKTFGGMEFYESRDEYMQCDEVDPDLDEVVPDDEEPVPNRGPKENLPRLRGLGDKLDCFKAKYFGENPFDSPLFFEEKIEQPTAPTELDPVKFAARILALPEENRRYFVPAQTKKTEPMTIKRMDSGREHKERQDSAETSKVQSSTVARGRRRYNDNHDRLKESSTQEPSQSQSQRVRKRRPVQKLTPDTTEATAVKPATSYEKEVYDDVMGTIKNLASLYEMIESQTVTPVTETAIVPPNSGRVSSAPITRNGKTLSRLPPLSRIREKNLYPSGATETPSYEEIEGLLPPPELNKKPQILPYRANKISYKTRPRIENPPRHGDRKIIGYYRTVKVHKRSLDDHFDARSNVKIAESERDAKKSDVPDSEVDESQANYRTVSIDAPPSTTANPNRKRKRKTNLGTTTTTTPATVSSETSNETRRGRLKSVYAVKTRAKNSKDEKTRDRYEVFTTTQRTTSSTDDRRKEPRYREIMRRRGQTATTTTTVGPQRLKEVISTKLMVNPEVIESSVEPVTEPVEIYESEHSYLRGRKVSIADPEPSSDEHKLVESESKPEHLEKEYEGRENYDEESIDELKKSNRKYDVHEDVQEETTPSTVGFQSPFKTYDHVDLETYLSTDPPGFREAFAEVPSTKAPYSSADKSSDDKDYREEASKEQVEDDGGEYNSAPENDSHQEEESSEEDDIESSKIFDSSSKNTDEFSADEKKHPEPEDTEVGTFFSFNARPASPFESFEDKKYSDLGPRINKPAFYHPHFEPSKYEGHFHDDSAKEEKGKIEESSENEKYEFPWAHDEEDEKAEARDKYVDEATEKYEYPWEKRERLAEERKKRRKDRERLKKLRDFSFFDDADGYDEDEDEKKSSSSETNKRVTYPWQYYDDVPSKASKKITPWKSVGFDSEEMSSNHRPVAKFSSKYSSSKLKLPFQGGEPVTVAEPKKIRKSVLNFLREADEKSSESAKAYGTDISINPKASNNSDQVNELSNVAEKKLFTSQPPSSATRNNKRISNSGIVPENITPAPRNANRSRVTPFRDRTTLRPSIRSTTDAAAVSRTTVAPITTTRRPWRLRGRSNITGPQPPYRAEEYRVVTSTAFPTQLESTTEKPGKSGNKNSGRVFVRKRGYVKNAVRTSGSNASIKPSSQSSDIVTQRSPPATTTIRRRKLPTVTTGVPITESVSEDAERANRPSKFGPGHLVKGTTYDEHKSPTMSPDIYKENSTPTGRTVEHRSRVSEEEIITKTSFPDDNATYKIYKNKNTMNKSSPFSTDDNRESLTNRRSKLTYSKTPERAKNPSATIADSPEGRSVENESTEKLSTTTEETSERVYQTTKTLDGDYLSGRFDSVEPVNQTVGPSTLEDELRLEKTSVEEVEEKTDRAGYNFDEGKRQSAESEEEIGGVSLSAEDSSVLSQVPPKSPPGSNELKVTEENSGEIVRSEENSSTEYGDRYDSGYEESDESEDDESSEEERSFAVKIEKDPSRRMYYFLDDKK